MAWLEHFCPHFLPIWINYNPSCAAPKSGKSWRKSEREPLALTIPAVGCPTTSFSHVCASISTTFGGVPRVCVGPSIACTAPTQGTLISTDRPGCLIANSSNEKRTAVRRSASVSLSPAANRLTEPIPTEGSIFLFTRPLWHIYTAVDSTEHTT